MGTETRLFARIDLLRIRRLVKLNNPLMGTETFQIYDDQTWMYLLPVKLNNPLMGTETYIYGLR